MALRFLPILTKTEIMLKRYAIKVCGMYALDAICFSLNSLYSEVERKSATSTRIWMKVGWEVASSDILTQNLAKTTILAIKLRTFDGLLPHFDKDFFFYGGTFIGRLL